MKKALTPTLLSGGLELINLSGRRKIAQVGTNKDLLEDDHGQFGLDQQSNTFSKHGSQSNLISLSNNNLSKIVKIMICK